MTQEEIVQKWLGRVETAKQARSDVEEDWEKNRQMIQASTYTDAPKMYSRVWVNLMNSIVRTMVPNLYFKNPEFTTLPKREADERSYRTAQQMMNYYARTTGLKTEMKAVVRDALVCTFGALKVGWIFEEVDVSVELQEDGSKEVVDDSEEHPTIAARQVTLPAGIGSRPFCARVSPWNLLRNRGSTSIKNANWVAERIFLTREEVMADPQYQNKADLMTNAVPSVSATQTHGEGIISTDRGSDQYLEEARALADPDEQLVELWEIWDRISRKRIVVARGNRKPLVYKDWPMELEGRFPYIELMFSSVPDEPYPIAYCSVFREIVQEINIISSYELEFVKRATPHVAVDTNVVDEPSMEALRSGEPVGVVKVRGNVRDAVTNVGGASLNPDLKWVHVKAEENLQGISSVADFIRGGAADPGELATVAKLRVGALSMTVQEMQDVVADAMVEWAEDVDMMAKQFCDTPTAIRIAGEDGFSWKNFTKTDIAGRYEYQIVPGSTLPLNEDTAKKQALDVFNLSAPFIQPGSLAINGAQLFKELARFFKIPNIERILGLEKPPPPADPAEENFLIQEGGSPQVSPDEDFDQHRQIHVAWLQQLQQAPQPDTAMIQRLIDHLKATDQLQQQVMVQQLLKQQMMMQAAAGMAGGPSERQPGSPIARGPGNGGPANNGPIRPRMMSEQPPDLSHQISQAGRSQPNVP